MKNNQVSENKEIKEIDTIIIGGGAAGLFLGVKFLDKGFRDFLILEKSDKAGGLCRSFKLGGAYYDTGAHALHKEAFLNCPELQKIIDINKLHCQRRHARVYIFNRLIPHPLQLHLFYAPFYVKWKCLLSYLLAKLIKTEGNNLYSWSQKKFGKKLCEYFLYPYNEKHWKTDLKKVNINWTSRVSLGDSKFFKGLFFRGNSNYNSNEYVCYPKTGGFNQLFDKIIKKLNDYTVLNTGALDIDLINKKIVTKGNFDYKYKNIITTIPVDIMIKRALRSVDPKIVQLADRLEKTSVCLVNFLVNKKSTNLQRIYVPGKEYFAHRVIINSNSNLAMNASNYSLLSLEISYKNKLELAPEALIFDNCKKLLADLDLISEDRDIVDYKIEYFEYMYPVQTVGVEDVISQIKSYLRNYDCYTVGRFGSWNYANIDGIMNEVMTLIGNLF